jgi:hypothetical protein
MPLTKQDFAEIQNFIKENLSNWLIETIVGKPPGLFWDGE